MAGLKANRGDAVYCEDETTLALEQRIARLTGKEDAMFVLIGTAGNGKFLLSSDHQHTKIISAEIAIRTHLTQPPHSVLSDSRSHIHV